MSSRERLDAYVMQFPKGSGPTFVRYPANLAESEAGGRAGSGPGAVPGQGSEESGSEVAHADMPRSARVFRVIWCPRCDWQYGAHWVRAEVYGYWGDCPHCGAVTQVRASYSATFTGAKGSADGRRAVEPAQQELGL